MSLADGFWESPFLPGIPHWRVLVGLDVGLDVYHVGEEPLGEPFSPRA